jgi:hypothetical protein
LISTLLMLISVFVTRGVTPLDEVHGVVRPDCVWDDERLEEARGMKLLYFVALANNASTLLLCGVKNEARNRLKVFWMPS